MTSSAVVDGVVSVEGSMSTAVATARTHRPGLALADHVTLFLIGLVVVLVSLPRLRRFALRENETDAASMLHVLWTEAESQGVTLHPGVLGALFGPGTGLQNRSEDVELLGDGRLRRHGYLFDVIEGPRGGVFISAWPWEHGRTGLGVYCIDAQHGLVGYENQTGCFSGPARPPSPADLAVGRAWRPILRL
jgi:hypothetical protein